MDAGGDIMEDGEKDSLNILNSKNVLQTSPGSTKIENKLNRLIVDPLEFTRSLPNSVQRKIRALKKLQFQYCQIESKFFEEVHDLETRYSLKFKPLLDKRANIVSGEYEPNEKECSFVAAITPAPDSAKADIVSDNSAVGIPKFWLTIFKHTPELAERVFEKDEDVLKHLVDVYTTYSSQPMSFSLNFVFSSNEYFTDSVLTKKYTMKSEPDAGDLMYEGPVVIYSEGTPINWKPGKDVTVRTVKKKEKHKKSGAVRTVMKEVMNESFFSFFSSPTIDEQLNPCDEEFESSMQADFEMGYFIRENVVSKAVLYFTGEAQIPVGDNESEYDDDDEDQSSDFYVQVVQS